MTDERRLIAFARGLRATLEGALPAPAAREAALALVGLAGLAARGIAEAAWPASPEALVAACERHAAWLPWPVPARAHGAEAALAAALALVRDLRAAAPDLVADPLWLGRVYQAWNAPDVAAVAPRVRACGGKVEGAEVALATQLYTEPYMAAYLVRHTLGRLDDAEAPTVLDPACGAGHLLVPAFDACFDARRARFPHEMPGERAARVLEGQIFGLDIDAAAVGIARASLLARARERAPGFAPDATRLQVHACAPEIGALLAVEAGDAPDESPAVVALLRRRYDVVLANPPYLGRKTMSRALVAHLARHFPEARHDLFAAFLARGLALVRPGGRAGFVTMKSWLYQAGFARLRERLWRDETLVAFADLGSRAFPPERGLHEGVSVALTCWRHATPGRDHEVVGVSAVAASDPAGKAARLGEGRDGHRFRQADLLALPGAPFCYDLPPALARALERGGDLAGCVKQGLATTDNQRFLRFAWELPVADPAGRWVPCARGGTYRKWAGLDFARVNWQADGALIKAEIRRKYPYLGGWAWVAKNAGWYFQPGLTYSYMGYGAIAARELDGAVFEVASIAVFPQARGLDRARVFAALNTRTASWMLRALSQKHMFQAGMTERLPLPEFDPPTLKQVAALVDYCVTAKRRLLRQDPREGAHDPAVWQLPPARALAEAAAEAAWLHAAEGALEDLVCRGYGLDEEARRRLVAATGMPAGWLPLAPGRLPKAPSGLPAAVKRFLATLPKTARPDGSAVGLEAAVADETPGDGRSLPAETALEARALALGCHPLALRRQAAAEERRAWVEEAVGVRVLALLGHPWPGAPEPRRASNGVWRLLPGDGLEALAAAIAATLAPGLDFAAELGMPLETWLAARFSRHHASAFKRRPVVWQLASRPRGRRQPAFACLVHAHGWCTGGLEGLLAAHVVPVRARLVAAGAAAPVLAELDDFADAVRTCMAAGFDTPGLAAALAREPLDRFTAATAGAAPPADADAFFEAERAYRPDPHDGVRVNLAPLQRAGLLAAPLLAASDVERAIAQRAAWRADERQACRNGLLPGPVWWG